MKQSVLDKEKRSSAAPKPAASKRGKAEQAEEAFRLLLSESSRRGFYGVVSLSLNVQDGHIQHVRLCTERQLK